jgi:hypothetical protein
MSFCRMVGFTRYASLGTCLRNNLCQRVVPQWTVVIPDFPPSPLLWDNLKIKRAVICQRFLRPVCTKCLIQFHMAPCCAIAPRSTWCFTKVSKATISCFRVAFNQLEIFISVQILFYIYVPPSNFPVLVPTT